jgi:hypothetical protein
MILRRASFHCKKSALQLYITPKSATGGSGGAGSADSEFRVCELRAGGRSFVARRSMTTRNHSLFTPGRNYYLF